MATDTKILKIAKEFDEIKARLDSYKGRKNALQADLASVNQLINDAQLALDGVRQSLKDAVNEP